MTPPYFTFQKVKLPPMETRDRILHAAKEIAQESTSINGVVISLDAVAQRVKMTKPGLMYHFPTKRDLMLGLVEQAAARWDDLLSAQTQSQPDTLSVFDRYRAYVTVATTAEVSRADYWILSGALYHQELVVPWNHHLGPWYTITGVSETTRSLLTAARFCADGAWMSEATGVFTSGNLPDIQHHALQLINTAAEIERSRTP